MVRKWHKVTAGPVSLGPLGCHHILSTAAIPWQSCIGARTYARACVFTCACVCVFACACVCACAQTARLPIWVLVSHCVPVIRVGLPPLEGSRASSLSFSGSACEGVGDRSCVPRPNTRCFLHYSLGAVRPLHRTRLQRLGPRV